jgi:hypothetical protein
VVGARARKQRDTAQRNVAGHPLTVLNVALLARGWVPGFPPGEFPPPGLGAQDE